MRQADRQTKCFLWARNLKQQCQSRESAEDKHFINNVFLFRTEPELHDSIPRFQFVFALIKNLFDFFVVATQSSCGSKMTFTGPS